MSSPSSLFLVCLASDTGCAVVFIGGDGDSKSCSPQCIPLTLDTDAAVIGTAGGTNSIMDMPCSSFPPLFSLVEDTDGISGCGSDSMTEQVCLTSDTGCSVIVTFSCSDNTSSSSQSIPLTEDTNPPSSSSFFLISNTGCSVVKVGDEAIGNNNVSFREHPFCCHTLIRQNLVKTNTEGVILQFLHLHSTHQRQRKGISIFTTNVGKIKMVE